MSILPDLTGPNLKTGTESRHDWTMEDLVTSIMSPMSWAAPMVRIGFPCREKGYTASWLHVYRRRKEQRLGHLQRSPLGQALTEESENIIKLKNI